MVRKAPNLKGLGGFQDKAKTNASEFPHLHNFILYVSSTNQIKTVSIRMNELTQYW